MLDALARRLGTTSAFAVAPAADLPRQESRRRICEPYAAYDASKGGSEALTRALALDLAPCGVRVAAIVPGLIRQERQSAESVALAAATVPLERMGDAADVAAAVAFIVSDEAAYISGATLVVDGGLLAQQRSPQVETFPVSSFPPPPTKEVA